MENKAEKIKKHVAEDNLTLALEELFLVLKDKNDLDLAILLSAQFNDINRQIRLGTANYETAAVSMNRIRMGILELLRQTEGEIIKDNQKPDPKGHRSFSSKRLALVVGCSKYEYAGELKNPINDAKLMKVKLELLGFDVILRENPDLRNLKLTIDDFGIELKNYDVGLFYFAGHGVQVGGHNYLVPIEAELTAERLVEYDCVRADRVLSHMEFSDTEINIVILDACRNNPFERSWGRGLTGRGLATMDAPKGSFIAYATAPGKTASDGEGENGLYTNFLSKEIEIKNLPITQLFQRVRKRVIDKSNNLQVPWEATSLTSDFYFNP